MKIKNIIKINFHKNVDEILEFLVSHNNREILCIPYKLIFLDVKFDFSLRKTKEQ